MVRAHTKSACGLSWPTCASGSGLGSCPVTYNAGMGPAEVQAFCSLETAAEPLLAIASDRLCLSARAIHRVLKLARPIADLAGSETIAAAHVAEALQYRPRLDWS